MINCEAGIRRRAAKRSTNIRLMRGEILYEEKINCSNHGVCNECFARDSFGAGNG